MASLPDVSSPRDDRGPNSSSQNEATEQDLTAKRLVERQHEQQKRRRTAAGGRGSSMRTSLWSTVAARLFQDQCTSTFKFECNVCGVIGSMNKTMSTSNVIDHFKAKHFTLHCELKALNKANVPEHALKSRIADARDLIAARRSRTTLDRFFRSGLQEQSPRVPISRAPLPRDEQAVAIVLFSCITETPCSQISSPMLQGLVDVFGGRMQFSSSTATNKMLYETYAAVCRLLRASVSNAKSGCITVDGWSAALGAPILGVTSHYIDDCWNLRCVPIATLNMGIASKTGQQLRCMIEAILEQNPIVGSDDIRVHTATSDNEAATALAVDLLTNFVGSVRCVVHTLALAVNDVFETDTVWKKYLEHVNKVTTYFNHHQKAAQLLAEKQLKNGVTPDRLHRLKHDIPTRWHSRLAAMSVYLSQFSNITAVAEELSIEAEQLPTLSENQQDVLAEFITVLAEVRRVARQLEADKIVTMSRAPRLLRELNETLLIIAGNLSPSSGNMIGGQGSLQPLDISSDEFDLRALPTQPSIATSDTERDEVRLIRLRMNQPKALAIRLADRVKNRLGYMWERVDPAAVVWQPDDEEDLLPDRDMHNARRVLLFHISSILDVNECSVEFLDCSEAEKTAYFKLLHTAVVREAVELDNSLLPNVEQLEVIFSMLHSQMINQFVENGRRQPGAALEFWRQANANRGMISPVPFNTIARADLSTQASSAPAERLFSDLGRREGNQSQSLLSSTMEMTEMIRTFVRNEIRDPRHGQTVY